MILNSGGRRHRCSGRRLSENQQTLRNSLAAVASCPQKVVAPSLLSLSPNTVDGEFPKTRESCARAGVGLSVHDNRSGRSVGLDVDICHEAGSQAPARSASAGEDAGEFRPSVAAADAIST